MCEIAHGKRGKCVHCCTYVCTYNVCVLLDIQYESETYVQVMNTSSISSAPTAPRSFSVETVEGMSMQLGAMWMEPSPTNGRITTYSVSCRENGTTDVYTVTTSESTSVQIQGLTPFTTYECFVTANTSAGEGGRSNTDTAITAEDGEITLYMY